MDSNDPQHPPQAAAAGGADGDWRSKLQPHSRRIIIGRIMETLKNCARVTDQENNEYFHDIAKRFEAKVFAAACNQHDYLRRISTKLSAATSKASAGLQNAVPSNSAGMGRYPQTAEIQNVQPQMQSQVQLHPMKMEPNQPAAKGRQQLSVQDAQYNITSAGMSSASLSSSLPPGSSLPQHPVSNVIPNPNMQKMSGVSQDLNSRMHKQGGQNVSWAGPQHQIHQSQNSQRYIKQQPELSKQEVYEGGAQQTLLQPCVQLQQKMSNPIQLQSAQQHYQERLPLQTRVGHPPSGISSTGANKNMKQTMKQPEISVQQPSSSASALLSGCGQQQTRQQETISQISSQMVQLQQQFAQPPRISAKGESTFPGSAAQPGDSGDWKEEVYQKVKALKETYFADLVKIYKNVSIKVQQYESLPQQYHTDKLEGAKRFKKLLEYLLHFLQTTKSDIQQQHKDRLVSFEKKIMDILGYQMRRIAGHELPRRQLPPPHGQSLQQTHEYKPNLNPHPVNLQGSSVRTMQPVTASNLHDTAASSSSIIPPQQRVMNSLQSSSNVNLRRESARTSVDKVSVVSAQRNPSASEKVSSCHGVIDLVHSNIIPAQAKSDALQIRHPKQPNEHESVQQAQQRKQAYQHNHSQKNWQPHQKEHQVQVQRTKQVQPVRTPPTVSNKDNQHPPPKLVQEYQPSLSKVGTPLQLSAANIASKTTIAIEKPSLSKVGTPLQLSAANIASKTTIAIEKPSLSKVGTPLQFTAANIASKTTIAIEKPSLSKVGTPLQLSAANIASKSTIAMEKPSLSKVGTPLQLRAANTASKMTIAIETPQKPPTAQSAAQSPQPDGDSHSTGTISEKTDVLQHPFKRLLRVMKSSSSKALSASVNDINMVVCITDQLAGPQPGIGSTAAVVDNLSAMTRFRQQDRNLDAPDKSIGIKRTWDCTNPVLIDVTSTGGNPKCSSMQSAGSEAFYLDSSATFGVMRRRIETNPALLEEINNVNQRLIDTVVDVVGPNFSAAWTEGEKGTVVKCSFNGVSLSPSLKLQFASGHMSPIQPLRLLIPANYPNCSPIILDKCPVTFQLSKEYEELCTKAESTFKNSLRELKEPVSLMDVARLWDNCVRSFITDYAQLHGGGTFSTKFGVFEDCLSVA